MIIITITGPMGKDPETRSTPSGAKVTSWSVATSIGFGEKKQTVWWNVSYWGDKFDKMLPYLKKGKIISITGSLSREPQIYTGKDGVAKVSALDITAEMINFVGTERKEGDAPSIAKSATVHNDSLKYAFPDDGLDGQLPF